MTDYPAPDPVREEWARKAARKSFNVAPDPDAPAATALGQTVADALKAASRGGTPFTPPTSKDAA